MRRVPVGPQRPPSPYAGAARQMSAAVKPTGASLKVKVTSRAVVAVAQRGIDDVDRYRRVARVDRDGVGAAAEPRLRAASV